MNVYSKLFFLKQLERAWLNFELESAKQTTNQTDLTSVLFISFLKHLVLFSNPQFNITHYGVYMKYRCHHHKCNWRCIFVCYYLLTIILLLVYYKVYALNLWSLHFGNLKTLVNFINNI